MDKRVIFAVAGSGKTTHIINQLDLSKRSMVITYTNNNLNNLRAGIIKKWGYFPQNISLLPYFTFLYSFCFRPFLSCEFKTKGINYDKNSNLYAKQNERKYFIDKFNRIYSNRIAKLLIIGGVLNDVNNRISKYFDHLFIDEIQDLAGHDFNFLLYIAKANINITLVGDFYQHTFDTSRDCTVNKTLHDDYDCYRTNFKNAGFIVDTENLKKSYRCSPTVCDFITNKIGINIESHRVDETKIYLICTSELADQIFKNNEIVKLFFKEHYRYCCFSRNWGDCKGEDKYIDICVVMNKKTFELYNKNKLKYLASQTKNKLYVACSRAKKDIYLVSEEYYKKYKA